MTKQDELKLLRKMAEKLGEASYFGPWLKEHLPEIEARILDDFPIDFERPKVELVLN